MSHPLTMKPERQVKTARVSPFLLPALSSRHEGRHDHKAALPPAAIAHAALDDAGLCQADQHVPPRGLAAQHAPPHVDGALV